MLIALKELMDKLGVGYELSAYETCPWSVYDPDKGVTCSAEVRMGADADELEAEIQILTDTPPEDGGAPIEQVFWLMARPEARTQRWSVKKTRVRGNDYTNAVHGWEKKACSFFSACVQELKMGTVPDFDALAESELGEGRKGGNMMGGGGGKSPKIKPQKLLGMKQGRGF